MNKIAWLEEQIEKAGALVPQGSRVSEPSSPFAGLAAESMRAHLAELQHDLYLAKAERANEVVAFRLIGPRLNNGAISLVFLAKLAGQFSRAMEAISYRIQHGTEERRASEELQDMLDLRLADVTRGSTQLVIVGNTTPDLMGDSLLESSLKTTFALLSSPADALTANALVAGPKAARIVGKLLKELEHEKCGVDLSWTDASDTEYRWEASPQRVSELRYRLDSLAEVPPEVIVILGTVELLSSTGRVTIRTEDGEKVSAKFTRELYPRVQELHLGQRSEFTVLLNRMRNPNTEQDVKHYTLLAVGRSLPEIR